MNLEAWITPSLEPTSFMFIYVYWLWRWLLKCFHYGLPCKNLVFKRKIEHGRSNHFKSVTWLSFSINFKKSKPWFPKPRKKFKFTWQKPRDHDRSPTANHNFPQLPATLRHDMWPFQSGLTEGRQCHWAVRSGLPLCRGQGNQGERWLVASLSERHIVIQQEEHTLRGNPNCFSFQALLSLWQPWGGHTARRGVLLTIPTSLVTQISPTADEQ